jgi:glycosyltransferase involved in cell wall biosynthesis
LIKPRLGIFYKNFAAHKGISHIGLGVAALANSEYLKEHGDIATVFPVRNNIDIMKSILDYQKETGYSLTHVIISAPWISTRDVAALVAHFHSIQWCIVSHSNVGFLQADPSGIHLLRDYIELSAKHDNLSIGGNSERFVKWVRQAYSTHCVHLPNLYPISASIFKSIKHGIGRIMHSGLKIGSFGAIRPLKNQLTAAAAAIVIGQQMKMPVEFHLSAGREEGGGNIVLNAIEQMTSDLPNFKLVKDGWSGWLEFRDLVADMDLLIHPSYTESFNIVTADGVSQGVPTVGSEAIHWLPADWKADSDDALEIAETGIRLLNEGASEGLRALRKHNELGFVKWQEFLAT